MKHSGTVEIKTDRLILRRFKKEDAEPMYENWAKDPENVEYLSWPSHSSLSVTKRILKDWIQDYKKRDYYHWCIVHKDGETPIGDIEVRKIAKKTHCCEVGYVVSKKYWGKGIMTEVLNAVIDYLFDVVGFNRIEAKHDTNNPASGKVMTKCGMTYEGTLRQADTNHKGEFCDIAIYSILKQDHEAAQKTCIA